ncbi:DNA binding regulatory protein AmdX [Sclerotinia borealis F-4128]|uniref:DNA binding regulatory protein AmdX n=1 Tax=Sclerotinia borealis (strain F-4128) TaxID=1432307 RepID=W9CKJ5_SCLBF|nr:DNA binding regulatory protein AmdX [Sclerotinia borealis F-4128]
MPAATSSNSAESDGGIDGGMNGGENALTASGTTTVSKPTSTSSLPKSDKPKPHRCDLCKRGFARLEHLKRHYRSHTKEKPFECPQCKRCFARRDLLSRHQNKLHSIKTPLTKLRKGSSQESMASSAAGAGGPNRVQKNSIANPSRGAGAMNITNPSRGTETMRPRANTISNIEGVHLQVSMDQAAAASLTARNQNHAVYPNHGHSRHPSLTELPMNRNYGFGGPRGTGGMSTALDSRGINHALPPKLETSLLHRMDYSNPLRTAPVAGCYSNSAFEFNNFRNFGFPPGDGSTINPNALHFNDSPQSMAVDSVDPFQPNFSDMSTIPMLDDNFDWSPMGANFSQMNFDGSNENAIDGSSSSVISTASHSGISEGVMLDGSNTTANSTSIWQQPLSGHPLMTSNFVDHGNQSFANLPNGNSISPHTLSHTLPHTLPYNSPHTLPHALPYTPPQILPYASPPQIPGTLYFPTPAQLGPDSSGMGN